MRVEPSIIAYSLNSTSPSSGESIMAYSLSSTSPSSDESIMAYSLISTSPSSDGSADPLEPCVVRRIQKRFPKRSSLENGVWGLGSADGFTILSSGVYRSVKQTVNVGVDYINNAGIIQMLRDSGVDVCDGNNATGLLILLDTDSTNKLDLQKIIDAAYTAKYIAERESDQRDFYTLEDYNQAIKSLKSGKTSVVKRVQKVAKGKKAIDEIQNDPNRMHEYEKKLKDAKKSTSSIKPEEITAFLALTFLFLTKSEA